jgi:hypothetical protein
MADSRPRFIWAVIGIITSLLAIALEGLGGILAGEAFDPIAEKSVLLAYFFVPAMVAWNEWMLSKGGATHLTTRFPTWGREKILALSIAGTVVALTILATVCVMLLPVFAISVFLLPVFGFGMIGLAPVTDTVVLSVQLHTLLRLWKGANVSVTRHRQVGFGAMGLALVTFFWMVVRPITLGVWTRQAITSTGQTQQNALAKLRFLHGDQALQDLAYGRQQGYNGNGLGYWFHVGFAHPESDFDPLTPWGSTWGYRTKGVDWWEMPPKARRAYFLLTGTPFEMGAKPFTAQRQTLFRLGPDDTTIEEQGGAFIGRQIDGLTLLNSEKTERVEGDTKIYDWVLTFKNEASEPQEARAELFLPQNTTIHNASLWMNGKEVPARYGYASAARAAYENVVKVQRRDPLLVSMPSPGFVQFQCYPVPANGGTMKMRLGILASKESREMPYFGHTNFELPGKYRNLFNPQVKTPFPVSQSGSLVGRRAIVIDASVGMNGKLSRHPLIASLVKESYTKGSFALYTTDGKTAVTGITVENLQDTWEKQIAAQSFQGGTDPSRVLNTALKENDAVLFLHAAMPEQGLDLDQVRVTLKAQPQKLFFDVMLEENASNGVLRKLGGFHTYQRLSEGSSFADMQHYILTLRNVNRTGKIDTRKLDLSGKTTFETFAIAAFYEANSSSDKDANKIRIAWGKAAADAKLVTPFSSAIVMENNEDYGNLDDPNRKPADPVNPMQSLPEPGTLLLLALGGIASGVLRRRRGR